MVVSGWCWTVSVSAICCLHKDWRFEHQLILHRNKCSKEKMLSALTLAVYHTENEIRWLHTAACICFNIFATLVFLSTRFGCCVSSSFNDERTVCAKDIPMIRFLSSYYSIQFFSFSTYLVACCNTKCIKDTHRHGKAQIHKKQSLFSTLQLHWIVAVFTFSYRCACTLRQLNQKRFLFNTLRNSIQNQFLLQCFFLTLPLCLSVSKFDYPVLPACRSIFQPIWWALRDGI